MLTNLKTILAASLFCAGVMATAPAHAGDRDFQPYIGFDLQRMSYDYNNSYDAGGGITLDGGALLNEDLDSINVHVGTRINDHVGVELGYFRSREEGKSIAAGDTVGPGVVAAVPFSTKVRVHGVSIDALGYFPLGEEGRVELIGTVGASWTNGEVTLATTTGAVGATRVSTDESEVGGRIGAGAQVNITEQINIRGLVRYQTADFDDVADHAVVYAVGLNYSF